MRRKISSSPSFRAWDPPSSPRPAEPASSALRGLTNAKTNQYERLSTSSFCQLSPSRGTWLNAPGSGVSSPPGPPPPPPPNIIGRDRAGLE